MQYAYFTVCIMLFFISGWSTGFVWRNLQQYILFGIIDNDLSKQERLVWGQVFPIKDSGILSFLCHAPKNIRDIDVFSDYSGRDNNYDDGVQYFVDKFLSKNKSGSARQIYYHVTCATDTENVSRVFNACKEIVLRQNIKKSVLS